MKSRNYATRVNGRDDTIFTLLSGKHQFEKHTHDTYSVGIMLSGYSFFSRENKKEVLHSGRVFIANPEEVHNCECGKDCDDWVYANIYPSVALMEELYMELGGDSSKVPIFPDACIEDNTLAQKLQILFGKIMSNNDVLDLESALIEILSQLILENADRKGKRLNTFEDISPKEIARTLEYLESVKDLNSIRVKYLAKVAGYSQYHFIRMFKQKVGMTPYAYAGQLRVLRARNMLLKGMPLANSALESGFSDQAHMTREFRKIFGVTPGKFL